MKLHDKIYDILKWLVVIVLPACGSLWGNLSSVWGLPYPDEIPKTIMYICTFLGAVLCISTAQYNKGQGKAKDDIDESQEPAKPPDEETKGKHEIN